MKRTFLLFLFSLLGAIFYCILMEGFHYVDIIVGLLISFLGTIIFVKGRDNGRISIKTFWNYVKYAGRLVYNIYKSSFIVMKEIFNKSQDVNFVKEECDENISPVAYANAITLSPGTVTVDKEEKTLTVLCFDEKNKGER